MSRKHYRRNKHHVYPSKDSRHDREIKLVDAEKHRRYHLLVGDMAPRQALRFIVKNFMPSDVEKTVLEVLK